ncbi:MAG: methyltransferase domain-containing protein [bacterium]|nr:methyltransferase domain-containing protein [bacterium]
MKNPNYTTIKKCRICGNSNLVKVLDFGRRHIGCTPVKSNKNNKLAKIKIPLVAVLCDRRKNKSACGAVQLLNTVNGDLVYRNIFYRTATNPMMRDAMNNVVKDCMGKLNLKKDDYVLDIGSNDGTLLTYYPSYLKRIGIDPTLNIDFSKLDPSIKTVTDYFSKKAALKASDGTLYKAITAIAMFYDLDDPLAFLSEIESSLALDGIFCVQMSYLPTSLKTLNFYDVIHEHLLYYTLSVFNHLVEKSNLYIFDVSFNDVNGGSIRVFLTHKNNVRPVSSEVNKILKTESSMKLSDISTYKEFSKKIQNLKKVTRQVILNEIKNGSLMIGLGSSNKGNTLLEFFDIDKKLLPYIGDRNPEKFGLRTVGTDIELISEEDARKLNPSCMLVLIWFFKDEVLKREKEYLEKGGKLLFPMPYPYFVTKDGEKKIDW